MKDIATIKGREFLTCRTFRRVGDEIIEAARSFDLPDVQRNTLKIRSVNSYNTHRQFRVLFVTLILNYFSKFSAKLSLKIVNS